MFEGLDPVPKNIYKWRKSSSGFLLELALYSATMVASRTNGLAGCNLLLFLRYLLRELDFSGLYGDGVALPEINFDTRFLTKFQSALIPFLPPMAIDRWRKTLVDALQAMHEIGKINLGLVFSFFSNSFGDLVIRQWPSNKIVLFGECKLYERNVDTGVIKPNVLNKFEDYPDCSIFLVCAASFAKMDCISGKYCFRESARNSDGSLCQIHLPSVNPEEAKRHVLPLELCSLNSREDQ